MKRIRQLTENAHSLAAGRRAPHAPSDLPDDLGELERALAQAESSASQGRAMASR